MKKIYLCLLATIVTASSLLASNVDLELTSVVAKKFKVVSTPVEIGGEVTNVGDEIVTSFDIVWKNGSSTYTQHIGGVEIAPLQTYAFVFNQKFIPLLAQQYSISVSVENVNGSIDIVSANNAKTITIAGTSRAAVKRVVAEEATGTWCGWCPRGAVFMDGAKADFGDNFIGIAVHNGDPMKVTEYDNALGDYPGFSGYPSLVLDRAQLLDPSALPSKIPLRLDNDAIAEMSIFGTYDAASEELNVTASAAFLSALNDIDYRLNIIITEDDVVGDLIGYNQANYYSGGGSGAMGGYESLGNPVPAADMVYEFVGRKLADGWEGTDGSVPTSVLAGEIALSSYNIDIDDDWNIDNLNIIAVLLDNEEDSEILNAISFKIADLGATAITSITNDFDFIVSPNPATENAVVRLNLLSTQDIAIKVTDINGKIVSNTNYGAQIGYSTFTLNTAELTAGIYFVNVIAGSQVQTQKIAVTH